MYNVITSTSLREPKDKLEDITASFDMGNGQTSSPMVHDIEDRMEISPEDLVSSPQRDRGLVGRIAYRVVLRMAPFRSQPFRPMVRLFVAGDPWHQFGP